MKKYLWYVAQPTYETLIKLCKLPVKLWQRVAPISYIETCTMCGVVIKQDYQGPEDEICAQCKGRNKSNLGNN